jgi:hypothetical protein
MWKQNVNKQSECSIISGGKGKEIALNKRVKLTQEFEETHEVTFIKSGPEKASTDVK